MIAEIITADAAKWLEEQPEQDSFITSLPDWDEVNMTFDDWLIWFEDRAAQIMEKTKAEGYAIFYQTDRKIDGELVDKSYLLNKAAERAGAKTLWHKIALKKDPEKTDLHRPTFTHLLCFSKGRTSGKAFPDVFYAGKMLYPNAMGLDVCHRACNFLADAGIKKVTDSFCGRGSVLLIAATYDLEATGIDIDPDQTRWARLILRQNEIELKGGHEQ